MSELEKSSFIEEFKRIWAETPPLKTKPKPVPKLERGALIVDDLTSEIKDFGKKARDASDHMDAVAHALAAVPSTWVAHYTYPPVPGTEPEPVIELPEAFYIATEVGAIRQYVERHQLAIGPDAEIDAEDFGFVVIQPALPIHEVLSNRLDELAMMVKELEERWRKLEAEIIAPMRRPAPYSPAEYPPSLDPGWGKPFVSPSPYISPDSGGVVGIKWDGSVPSDSTGVPVACNGFTTNVKTEDLK